MKDIRHISDTYREIISETQEKINRVQKQIYHTGSIRLILFVAGVTGIIYFRHFPWYIIAAIAVLTFIPFLILIKRHNRLFSKKDYLEKKLEINRQELKAIDYDTSGFDGGHEFIDPSHLYTYDLDVFGEHSLFQYINRTSTDPGKNQLAEWFNTHPKDKEEIELRQEAVKELTPELKFRQRFRVTGLLHKDGKADEREINAWAKSPSYYRSRPLLRALPNVILIINATCAVLSAFDVISFSSWGIVFVCCVIFSFAFSKRITQMQSMYGKKLRILGTYAKLIRLIEDKEMQAPYLKEIKSFVGENKQTASQSIQQLTKRMNALDQRNNMPVAIILNGLLFWELKQMMNIELWKEEYAGALSQWIKAIAQMDAVCALATFAYNHPGYTYPEITDEPFKLQATSLGHPLMNRDTCVCNDITMEKRPDFIIITGANMAGKSTYLRTIGINYLLACTGAPVFSDKMTLYPAQLITSLRTADSLTDNESYFFAELKRLKLIIDKLNAGEELFIILDEILKGTNSKDKQKGSIALIKQFMELNANGIIATHDLLLATLVEGYPDNIRNFCFEADITTHELTFSYRLREGVAQNMNACFLMKKMGIAVIDD
jgi:DNA mismatch repair ATPase MutS